MLGSLFYYNKGYTKVYNICEGQIKLVMALTSQNSNDLCTATLCWVNANVKV